MSIASASKLFVALLLVAGPALADVQIKSGATTDTWTIESTSRAGRVQSYPLDKALGQYKIAVTSGTLPAALAAGTATAGHVFAFRWTHATNLAVVTRIRLQFQPLTLFTAATLTDFGFDAFKLTAYSASHTGGTACAPPSRLRTSMTTSNVAATECRISAAAALTAGTHTFDGIPFAASLGDTQRVNPAAATEEQRVLDPTLVFTVEPGNGEYPLVLAQNEGFVIRNRTVWPAAGTGIIQVEVTWAEVSAY